MTSKVICNTFQDVIEAFNNKDCVFITKCENCEYYGESSGFCGHKDMPECFKPPKDFYCGYGEKRYKRL